MTRSHSLCDRDHKSSAKGGFRDTLIKTMKKESGERPVRIRPAGDAWLEVRDTFVCGEHLPKPTKTGDAS